jgi:hypothetical protein
MKTEAKKMFPHLHRSIKGTKERIFFKESIEAFSLRPQLVFIANILFSYANDISLSKEFP